MKNLMKERIMNKSLKVFYEECYSNNNYKKNAVMVYLSVEKQQVAGVLAQEMAILLMSNVAEIN